MKVDLKKTVASALSFAHLAGIGGKAAAKSRAEDDDDKDKPERDHEDGDAKGGRAEGDDTDKKDDDKKDSNASADDDYNDGQTEDDKPEGDDDDKKSKSKASDDKKDEDPDEEMRGNSAAASARRREQARCAAIFACPQAARNPVLAANLAFKTRMSRAEALAVLEATPAGAAAVNTNRSARNPNVGAGGSAEPSSKQKVDSSWDAAFKKVTPQRR